jgi:hypothetical protein
MYGERKLLLVCYTLKNIHFLAKAWISITPQKTAADEALRQAIGVSGVINGEVGFQAPIESRRPLM